MPFQRVPDSAAVDILWSYLGKTYENAPTFRKNGGLYTEEDLLTLAGVVDSWVDATLKPLTNIAFTYLRTEVRGLDSEFDYLKIDDTSTGLGTATGTVIPPNATFCLKLSSAFTGRSARGRWYTIGNSDAQLNSGDKLTFNVTYRSAIVAALGTLKDNAALMGWSWIIASRFHNGVKRSEAITFTVQNITYVNTDVDSQRRRLI